MKTNLNFAWRFVPGFVGEYLKMLPPSAVSVDLPHAAKEEPLSYFDEESYQGLFTYEKTFDVPGFAPQEKQFLHFEGVMLKVHPYLNGVDLGERISGWLEVVYDVTGILKEKGNRLVVEVDSREDDHVPPFGHQVDYLTFAGIYRPVYLESRPSNYIKKLHAYGDATGHLHISHELFGTGELSFRLTLGGKLIKEFSEEELTIANPAKWDFKTPNLYLLEAFLKHGEEIDHRSIRVGFRDAEFTEHGFYLNGHKEKLIGLNRHQNYPYVGPSLPASAQREDADLIKLKLGCNIVRTSHYPQSEAFLARCDELGLLVIDEIPGWQYIGKDKAWRENYYYFLEGMVEKERDHASLVGYGVRIDESGDDDDLYSKANDFVHKTDSYHPTLGVRNFKTSHCLEDIYCYNDFSCCSTAHGLDKPTTWKGAKGKPKMVSEHNGHMYVTKQYDAVDRRLQNALRHLRVIDDAYKYDDLCGAIGWCAFDYNTHKDFGSGDHICHHGVSDIFRNPKASAYAYASQRSELPVMWVANPPVTGDNDECILNPLYVFTNCDYVELYKDGKFIEVFMPDKKDFPHLPHAPIVINDFIGATFDEPKFKGKDAQKVKKALNLLSEVGLAHLTTGQKLKIGLIALKYHLDQADLEKLYFKYVSPGGKKPIVFNLKGYREGKLVNEKSFGPSTQFAYRFEKSSEFLNNAETYDVTRVSIKFVDQYGTQLHYAFRTISFETKGPIAVIGPSTIALEGGDAAVYVRSLWTDHVQESRLIVHTDLGDYNVDFTVQ
jgi:beta-galactosidase